MSKKSKSEAGKRPDPYAIDKLAMIPPAWKVGFLKFWLYGAVYYFIVFTLAGSLDYLDLLAVLYGVLVLGIEYLGNTLILWMHTDERPTTKFLPHEIQRKSMWSLLATAGYTLVVFVAVNLTLYLWVDILGMPTIGQLISEATADPITFSLIFLFYDFLWITLRGFLRKKTRKKDAQ